MACKADVRKSIYDQVMKELVEGRYTFTRLDDNTIQINGKVDNSRTKAETRNQARAIANQLIKTTYNSFAGQVTGRINEVSAYDPITVTFSATDAYTDWVYNNLPIEQRSDISDIEKKENQERSYINSNTGPNTAQQLFLFSPSTDESEATGAFEKYIQFKKTQVRLLENRLAEIERQKKIKDITTERLTKLKNLEREIKLVLNGNFELGRKGLKDEIRTLEKTPEVESVKYYAEKDLNRLSKLVESNDLDDLNEAQRIIDFYSAAGTFNKEIENPFFTKQDIFLPDEDGNLTSHFRLSDEVRKQYEDWASKARGFQNTVDDKKKQITTDAVNRDYSVRKTYGNKKFTFEDLVYSEKGLKDADWLSMWTMDITQGIASHNGLIPQVMFSYLTNSFEKKLAWAREIEEKIDKLNPGVQKELMKLGYTLRGLGILGLNGASYNLFKEVTKEGNETGGIVQRFVKEFYDEQSKALNNFRTSFDEAKGIENKVTQKSIFNKAFENLKRWRRNNTIILDITKIPEIISDDEFKEFGGTADDAYKQSLVKILGEKGYNEEIEKQKRLLRNYQSEKQAMLDTALQFEGKDKYENLSDKSKGELSQWENNHSPIKGHEDYHSITGISFGDRKSNNFMDYNHFIPRKYKVTIKADIANNQYQFIDTNELTGNYDKNFETIEGNKILSDFYDVIKEVTEVIRENMPKELQQKVAVNTLPGLMKTSAEIIADKNTGILNAMFLSFRHMWERVRMSFGVQKQSELSYAQSLDPITGKPNYRVNDGFLQGNAKAVGDRMTIEKIKFLQAYNKGRIDEAKMSKIKRFTSISLAGLNQDAVNLIAEYIHTEPTKDAIRKVTGDNIEIGRIIRDFSLHSVVQSQSFDLGKLAKYFSNMTMTYSARQEALPILEIMKKHYERIMKPNTNNIGEQLYNVPEEKYMKVGFRTNAIKQMDDWFERVALNNYGPKHVGVFGSDKEKALVGENIYTVEERKKLNEINELLANTTDEKEKDRLEQLKQGLGKTRTTTAAIDNLLSWIRTLRLGYNLASATTNFLEGVTSNVIVGASNQYFNPNDLFYGYGVIKHSFIKNITFGKAETALAKKNRSLMDKFNVIMDSKNELQKSSVRTTSSRLSWLSPHEMNQRVEYINQSPIMIAMLRTSKIKDKAGNESSVWNAYNKDGHLKDEFKTEENIKNWEELSGEEYLTFKQKLNKVIVLAHGNYDELRGMMAKSSSAGKAFMMFKTWLPNAIYQRFATEQDDIQAGTTEFKGKYLSYTATTGGIHAGLVGASIFGPVGALLGVGVSGAMLFRKGIKADVSFLSQVIETSKVLAQKMIGLPVNLIAGRKIINAGNEGFNSWVGKGNFTQQDADNMKSNMADLSMQMAWLALILITKSLFWDDDDKPEDAERKTHNIIVNKLVQLSSQAAMYINPIDKNNVVSSTLGNIAIFKYLEDTGKFVIALGKWINGDSDVIPTGVNAGESRIANTGSKLFLPGIFKDIFGERILGFGDQADKVFTESPWHRYYRSEEALDKEKNKSDRASRRAQLEKELKEVDFDGDTIEEQEKAKKKYIMERLDNEYPTPAKLKKLGMNRKEYED